MSDELRKRQKKLIRKIEKLERQITRNIDVVEHARIVRKELKKKFPHIKFMIRSDRFSGGSSVDVYHRKIDLTREQADEIQCFVISFDGYRGDLLDNRFNVGFEYNGERLRGASFCSYNGKWYR